MKATVISPANIAFIKFWGKKNAQLNLPLNDTLSMNLSNCLTKTTVEFVSGNLEDQIIVGEKEISGGKKERVLRILDLVREKSGIDQKAKVVSKNNFPEGAGIASSASAFSALALASSSAAGLLLSEKDLSILARLGSGSACRSVVSGFALWVAGDSSETSFACQFAPPDFWDLRDIVVVVDQSEKKIGSTEGHELATSSPYLPTRLERLGDKTSKIKKAFMQKDFLTFGQILEEEAVDLHLMAMSSKPPIYYWNEGTMEIILATQKWREQGLPVYFTIDAGPNVHLICLSDKVSEIKDKVEALKNVLYTIVNKPCEGSRLVDSHLF
jgi:diphosphomevalonate decarboxylase